MAARLAGLDRVVLDGFAGVMWEDLRAKLDAALRKLGKQPGWVRVEDALKPAGQIEALVAPFLGGSACFRPRLVGMPALARNCSSFLGRSI